jgi:hypothetical protein
MSRPRLPLLPRSHLYPGFPLYDAKGSSRLDALTALPASARAIFISGDKDEFITKQVPSGKSRGQALWDEVLASLQFPADIHMVPGGTHSCLPAADGDGQKKDACNKMIEWVKAFVLP